MKRFAAIAVISAVLMTLLAAAPVAAAGPNLEVRFNNHPVIMDEPVIENGRTLVPFRAILEAMGAQVTYDAKTRTVKASKTGTTVELVIGSTTAKVNGVSRTIPDGVAPKIIKSRTYIPLRFVSESLGLKVTYNAAEKIANIEDARFPKRGGTLQLAMWTAPAGIINPIMSTDAYDSELAGLIYDGLWYFDGALQPRPSLARYWEISADNRTITFYLRKGVKFHDGQPFTSADVRFTFESIMAPDYKGVRNVGFESLVGYDDFHSGRVKSLAGIETPDAYTVRFRLTEPYAPFFTDNTGFGILPRHKYTSVKLADMGTARDPNLKKPIGTGAFKFVSMAPSQFYMFDAYENYHLGKPYVDHLIYKVLSQDTSIAQMETSAIDAVDIAVPDLATVQKMSHVNVYEFPSLIYTYVGFNTTIAPFDDKRVRQAIAFATDTKALINDVQEGHAAPIYTHMHPLYWAFTEDVPKYTYNPARAEQLLEAAGWKKGADGVRVKDGKRLEIELVGSVGSKVGERIAVIMQQWLQPIGFKVTLTKYEFATLVDKVFNKGEVGMWLMAWQLSTDPDPKGIFDKSQIGPGLFNAYKWHNPRAQELMDQGVRVLDIEKRKEIYKEWQQIFADELPLFPLYARNEIYAVNKRVKNVKPSPAGMWWNLYEIYLD